MDARIEALTKDIETINTLTKALETNFAKVIADTSIPLVERWELFCSAPDSVKGYDSCTPNFECLEEHGITFYDTLYYERYQTIHMLDLVDQIEHSSRVHKQLTGISPEELVVLLKEEILKYNLGSVRYDW